MDRPLAFLLAVFLAGGAVASLWSQEWLTATVWGVAAVCFAAFVVIYPWPRRRS